MKINVVSIGCSIGGFDECITDAKAVADWYKLLNNWHLCNVNLLVGDNINKASVIECCKKINTGKWDVGFLYFSGCGYRKIIDNGYETGLWTGEEISSNELIATLDTIMQSNKPVIMFFDCCFSGPHVGSFIPLDPNCPGIVSDYPYRIKSVDRSINCRDAQLNFTLLHNYSHPKACVLCACGPDQFAYGKFDGKFGGFRSFSTNGYSLCSYVFFSVMWANSLNNIRTIIHTSNWRLHNAITSTLPDSKYTKRWLCYPKISFNIGKKFPSKILSIF